MQIDWMHWLGCSGLYRFYNYSPPLPCKYSQSICCWSSFWTKHRRSIIIRTNLSSFQPNHAIRDFHSELDKCQFFYISAKWGCDVLRLEDHRRRPGGGRTLRLRRHGPVPGLLPAASSQAQADDHQEDNQNFHVVNFFRKEIILAQENNSLQRSSPTWTRLIDWKTDDFQFERIRGKLEWGGGTLCTRGQGEERGGSLKNLARPDKRLLRRRRLDLNCLSLSFLFFYSSLLSFYFSLIFPLSPCFSLSLNCCFPFWFALAQSLNFFFFFLFLSSLVFLVCSLLFSLSYLLISFSLSLSL